MKLHLVRATIRHIIKHRKSYPVSMLLLLGLVAVNFCMGGRLLTASDSWWNIYLNPIVGLGTLFTAIAVWWGETSQDWRESLPKRLTVEFYYQKRLYMRCEHARLSGESDIRAFGQQIGLQMAAEKHDSTQTTDPAKKHEPLRHLDFKVAAVESSVEDPQQVGKGDYFLPYTATFEPTALPPRLKTLEHEGIDHLEWTPPFDEIKEIPLKQQPQ